MAYPDDKETFRRVVNQELPAIPGDTVDEDDQNLPASFLERLQDTLGYGIKMGYASMKAFFDYVVSQITLIAGKVNKAGDTMTGDLILEKPLGQFAYLKFLITGYAIKCYFKADLNNITTYYYANCTFFSSLSNDQILHLKSEEVHIYKLLNMNGEEIIGCNKITTYDIDGFTNAKKAGGMLVRTPDDTKNYRISVDNAGNVISTLVP